MLGTLRPAGALILGLVVAALGCRGEEAVRGNLLAGRATSGFANVQRAGNANDGVALHEGDGERWMRCRSCC